MADYDHATVQIGMADHDRTTFQPQTTNHDNTTLQIGMADHNRTMFQPETTDHDRTTFQPEWIRLSMRQIRQG